MLANAPVTPDPAFAADPPLTLTGGHTDWHAPEHADLPAVSELSEYNVRPRLSTRTEPRLVVPRETVG
jgi:hypothetical protein